MAVWIFQLNPRDYNVIAELNDPAIGVSLHRAVRQHKDAIKIGHIAILWMSGGENARIYAIGEVRSIPTLSPVPVIEQQHWAPDLRNKTEFRVEIERKYDLMRCNLSKPIIRNRNGLDGLSILRRPNGTNFSVTANQWQEIKNLIAASCNIVIP